MGKRLQQFAAANLLTIGAFTFNSEASTGERLPLWCGVEQSSERQDAMVALLQAANVSCVPVPESAADELSANKNDILVVTVDRKCGAVFTSTRHLGRTTLRPELAGSIVDISDAETLRGPAMWNGTFVHLDENDAYGHTLPEEPDFKDVIEAANYLHNAVGAGCARLPK